MMKEISSHKKGAVYFQFDNGNTLSIIWGWATYSDNYDLDSDEPGRLNSTTVEIMPGGHPAFIKWMQKKYDGDSVCGYVPVSELTAILKRADSKVYKPVESVSYSDKEQTK
jgi:hypothetical protein